jgi:hypothetical protein
MTATATAAQVPATVLATLAPGSAVGVRPCIPTDELRVDDVLFAAGFRRGGDRRRVLEIVRVERHGMVHTYVRVAEGWYRWTRVYVNVLEF